MRRTLYATAPVAALALVLVACAQPSQGGFSSGAGDDDVVLRVSSGGGFVPYEYTLTQVPEFTLYGDGRITTLGAQIEIYPQPALPPIVVRTVTQEAIDAIVRAAIDAGLDEDNDYRIDNIADADTTTFTLIVDGTTYTTSAYALGFGEEDFGESEFISEEDAAARAKLRKFRSDLSDLASWIDESELGEESMYEADSARVHVGEYQANEEVPQEPVDWPLDTPAADFGSADEFDQYACGVVSGADAEAVIDTASGANQLTPWVSDGEEFAVIVRPLLPDETSC